MARGVSGGAVANGAAGTRLVDRLSVRSGYGPLSRPFRRLLRVVDDLVAALAALSLTV